MRERGRHAPHAARAALAAAALLAATGASGVGAASAAGESTTRTSTAPVSTTPQAPAPTGEQAPATPAPARVSLSNERTTTTWAHPVAEAGIRVHPVAGSRAIAHTRLATEDGFPEVYMVLSTYTDAKGFVWVRLRIPARPNGRTGWVSREALGEFHVTHWMVVINLGARRLRAYYKGRLRMTAPVGVGKPSTPTPSGKFWIREIFRLHDRSNPYWPYALGTSAYSRLTDWPGGGVVGIHGDFGEPQRIPGDPSHGCVRMHAHDLAWLAPRLQLGTPVHITR
jgi:hypothetical protein